jgi:hypothetical protein
MLGEVMNNRPEQQAGIAEGRVEQDDDHQADPRDSPRPAGASSASTEWMYGS